MGIGRFYRWLSERYPLINEKIDASSIPAFDNLYLDMNGILHNCSHGNSGGMLHENEDLMWQSVFAALDLVISTIAPRKLLYLAADGVAPRAKMNQQRARRYRAAKSAAEAAAAEERQRLAEAASSGRMPQRSSKRSQLKKGFDSNCISPGTEFMSAFFRHLRFFCEKKLNEDSRWQGLKVLLSGPDVPGEGEHKIMAYLRCCKAAGNATPDTRHCLYGLDADLIMLCEFAATSPNSGCLQELQLQSRDGIPKDGNRGFSLRLSFFAAILSAFLRSWSPCYLCFIRLHSLYSFGKRRPQDAAGTRAVGSLCAAVSQMLSNPEKLQLLHISLLREYLAMDLLPSQVAYSSRGSKAFSHQQDLNPSFASFAEGSQQAEEEVLLMGGLQQRLAQPRGQQPSVDGNSLLLASERERVIDDFVIFCFLAGNDFLPHTLSTDIGEKGLDTMIACYRRFLAEYRFLAAAMAQKTPEDGPWLVGRCGQLNLFNLYIFLTLFVSTVEGPQVESKAADLRWLMQKKGGRSLDEEMELYASCDDPSEAFRALFYKRKLGVSVFDSAGKAELQRLCRSYLEGLQWVAYYYYRGPDGSGWRWFYPYHYAPFMHDVLDCNIFSVNPSDMHNPSLAPSAQAGSRISNVRDLSYLIDRVIALPIGQPYSPFMQLLSILPPQSAELLPMQLRPLLLSPPRELAASFPRDFEIDMEGVKVPWGGVTLLPFIDEQVLERIVEPLLTQLPPEVLQRNGVGKIVLLMRKHEGHEMREAQQQLGESGVAERLSALDSIYQSEHLFFVHKIISRQYNVAVDLLRLVSWVGGTNNHGQLEGLEPPRRPAFRSSLPCAFADVVDSCVCEEEVRILPPPLVARHDEAKLVKIIQCLGLEHEQHPGQGRGSSRVAARQYIELLLSALRGEATLPGAKQLNRLKLPPPTPCLQPFDHELLYPTTPLPGVCVDAAALTPSFYTKCFASQYGTGVKVFKRESANESVFLNVMPFPKDQLQHGTAGSLVDLLKPYDVFDELLSSSFVFYDFPFVKLATPVAIWLPTFYFPIKQREGESQAESASQPTQQLQVVEREKRRLRMQGIIVADEAQAYDFFEQHTSVAKRPSNTGQDSATGSCRASEQHLVSNAVSLGVKAERVQPFELQLEQLAKALIRALPGSRQQLQKRAFHPATACTTAVVELLPVEDVMMEEKLEVGDDTDGSSRGRRHGHSQHLKSSACVHFRYATQTVYRLLPLVSRPSEDLVRRMQQCRQDVLEAVEAYAAKTWKSGESVICVASSSRHQLLAGVTGVVENAEDEDSLQLSVRVAAWRSEPRNFEEELQKACESICASSQTFPSLGSALDEASTKSPNLSLRCHLKADRVFEGLVEPAFLATRLSSMAAQSPSRRAKAVSAEYAVLSAQASRAEGGLGAVARLASDIRGLTGCRVMVNIACLQLGQRLAYARFRGSVQQGSRGTACGFAPRLGACRIECQWNQLSGSQQKAALSVSHGGKVRFAPLVIELMVKKRLDLNAKNSKQQHGTHQHAQHQKLVPIFTEAEAQRTLSQLCGEDKLTLFQRQIEFLEGLSIEVLLDEPQLGASDGNGRIESLRLLSAPASHWLRLCEEVGFA
ncbi:hypothetical protein ACSSS7_001909 [Eimeria intestinalis]